MKKEWIWGGAILIVAVAVYLIYSGNLQNDAGGTSDQPPSSNQPQAN